MADYITIDGGTTNTRISFVKNYKVTDTVKLNIGAKAGIDNNTALKTGIKNAISQILLRNNCKESICVILASGMITSEFGLYKLPHITAPAGIKELHNNMEKVLLNEISDIPFVFIRGVKTDSLSIEGADMIRGEETELVGIMKENDGECVYVLPGSHSKVIHTDKEGRIKEFSTMLTGEMIEALSKYTILKDAVSMENTQLQREYLLKGTDYALTYGINEALFKVRVMKNILGVSQDGIYSFYTGAVLSGEVSRIIDYNSPKIIIGGKKQLKEALGIILKEKTDANIVCISDDAVDSSVSVGMIKIYEYSS